MEAFAPFVQLPFEHLNLRFNPFGERPLEERPGLAVIDPVPFLALLADERSVVQFVGEKGRGKTTHLLTLRAHRPAPYLHLPEDEPLPPVPTAEPLLYLDESQRLTWRVRRRLFRGPGRLVLGTHEDHTRALRWAGRPVTTIRVGADLTLERLRAILERRIESARRAPGAVPWIPEPELLRLLERFGDHLRGIEHHLYERFQTLKEPTRVEV